MKVLLKHIFSLFTMLLMSFSVQAQETVQPLDSTEVEKDTTIIQSPDTTIVQPTDTTIVQPTDTTIVQPADTAVVQPGDTTAIEFMDTTMVEPLDSTQLKPLDAAETEAPDPRALTKQEDAIEKEVKPKDTVRAPSGIEFAIDYGKLVSIPLKFESKAEGAVSISIKEKLQILGEAGFGEISPKEAIKNGEYTSKGTYARAGIAYGGRILPKSYVYLGFMYGVSRFEDGGTVLIESQAWDDYNDSFSRTGLEASWFEFILVSETQIKNNLFLGSKWRLRKLNSLDNTFDPVIYTIPGYGRTFDNTVPAVNLYVKYRIGF